jgi:hypothetical protein
MRNRLFWQRSPEDGFFDLSEVSGSAFQEGGVSRGAAFADYDGDGDIDVVIMNHQGPPSLLRNDTETENHWLKVRLECASGRGGCVGAVVEIETADGRQRREVGSQSSYLSQNAPEAHFGVGAVSVVGSLTVRFPSGAERRMEKVDVDQTLLIRE